MQENKIQNYGKMYGNPQLKDNPKLNTQIK